jgi:serine/threonine-protein kinase PknK
MVGMPAGPNVPGYGDLTPLGRGGYSAVYRAHQERFDRWVAVKVLSFELAGDRARQRFLRECRVAGRVSSHPHIVTVYEAAVTPDGRPYIAMELYDGGTAADRLRAGGPLAVGEALRIAVRVAGALESAHRAGIVHRDVKPGNVLLTSYGHPALGDFGLSVVAEHQEITAGSDALSPYHAPPEVLEGAGPSPVSDVYSLASTTYTMLAGRPAHQVGEGETLAGLLTRILRADVPPLGRDDVPRSLDHALAGAMARDPSARTPSALAFAQAIQQVQAELGLEVVQPVVLDPHPGADPAAPAAAASAPAAAAAAGGGTSGSPPVHVPATTWGPPGPDPAPPAAGDETVHRSRLTGRWPPAPVPDEPETSRRGPLLAALGLVVAAAVGVGLFAVARSDDETARPSSTSETTERPSSTTTTTDPATTTTTDPVTSTTDPTTTTTTERSTTTASGPPTDLAITQVQAASSAADAVDACGTEVTFGAGNVADGSADTAWRTDGDASGEWLTILLDGPHRVRTVGLVPGYAGVDACDRSDRFAENRRPTSVTWQFEDGTETTQRLRDVGRMQTISVDAQARALRLRIDGVTPATARDFTAISEVLVRGH